MTDDRPRLGLAQSLILYVGTSFAILQGADLFIDRFALPSWLFTAAIVLLVMGLPVVAATAYVQNRRTSAHANSRVGRLLTWRNAAIAGVVAFALLGAASAAQRMLTALRGDDAEWARGAGLLELARLSDEQKFDSAWAIAKRVQRVIPDDAAFQALRPRYARYVAIITEPAGLTVHRRFYMPGADTTYELVGTTPIDSVVVPRGFARWQYRQNGRLVAERVSAPQAVLQRDTLVIDTGVPAEMIRISGDSATLQSPGLDHLEPIALGPYLIDRYEVTNREYKRFVDAGGYRKQQYWKQPFVRGAERLSFDAAMRLLVDRTGRPGPSTWEVGDYPDGQDDHPVGGLSWYEAMAYADFAGKSLPTIYHWLHASGTAFAGFIAPVSNFVSKGTLPVGATDAMSPFGNYDMGGNVREWCFNASKEQRYILGGGYIDDPYQFTDGYAQPVWDRSAINGLRLVRYLDDVGIAEASRPVVRPHRDYRVEKPVADAEFRIYQRLFEYDRRELAPTIEKTDTTEDWIRQRVTIDAGYGGERMLINVFVPRNAPQPYQTVVMFPGSGAIFQRSSDDLGPGIGLIDFVVKSGRTVILPVYRGTYERGSALKSDYQSPTPLWREHVVAWVKEFRRTVDYIELRPDLDERSVAYFGFSWGGYMGGIIPALEPRARAVVLFVGGLLMQPTYPEVDPLNFLPRITQPVLMLNGRYDHFFPVETSQKPMFDLLGTPAKDKRYMLYERGHNVPRTELIKETLTWLDRYLGPVTQ